MPQFSGQGIDKNAKLLELLHRTQEEKNATPAQISLAWMLCKKPYLVPIPGTRNEGRMKENALAADIRLTGSVIDCCKIIAAQAVTEQDIWEMEFKHHAYPTMFIPMGAVVTASGTGAEMNNGAVITNEDSYRRLL